MTRNVLKLRKKKIIVDIDTQKDFFIADGRHCIRNHRRVLRNVRRVMAWARKNNCKTISTLQYYSPDDTHHDYCLEGSNGYGKIKYTVRDKHHLFEPDHTTDLPRDIFKNYNQIILPKRSDSPFEEPKAERILTELLADEFIVIGAHAESSIQATVLGLLQRGKKVTVVIDALGYQNRDEAEMALRKMHIKGAKLIETKQLAGVSKLENVNACTCDRCRGKIKKHNLKIGAA